MATKILDMSGRGGLAKKWGGDISRMAYQGYTQTGQPNLRYLANDGQIVSGISNPIRKYGYLSPASNTFLNVSQAGFDATLADEMHVRLIDDENDRIYMFSDDNDFIYGGFDGSGWDEVDGGASVVIWTDACIYYLNGVRTGFVAAEATSNDIIRTFNLTGTPVINDDWSSTDVTNSFALYKSKACKFVVSGDGFLYVLNRNAVHRIDGTTVGGANGTIYQDVLLGPTDIDLTHGVELNNKIHIIVQKNSQWEPNHPTPKQAQGDLSNGFGDIGMYIWNRQSTFFNSSNFYEIPGISYVTAMWVSPKGDIRIFGVMPTGEAKILSFTGSSFKTIETLPFLANPLTEQSLQVYGNFTYWLGQDGYIYGHGSEFDDEKEFLFIIGQYSSYGVMAENSPAGPLMAIVSTEASALSAASSTKESIDVMYIFAETPASTYILKQFFPFAENTVEGNNITRHQGDIYYPPLLLPTLSTVKHINIICAPVAGISGTDAEANIKIYFNQSTTAWATKTVTKDDIAKGYVSYEINKPFVNSIQLEVEHTTNSNIGTADFAPAYAEIIYEDTNALK